MPDLSDLTYQRPDLDQVENQLRRARLHLRLAMSAPSALAAVQDMERVTGQYRLAKALATVACLRGGQTGMEHGEELDFFGRAEGRYLHHLQQFFAALASSRYRAELETQIGRLTFETAGRFRYSFQPEAAQEMARERQLVAEYRQFIDGLRVRLDGQDQTLDQIALTLRSPDRALRRQAALALDDSLAAYAQDLDEHCDNLIKCRQQVASRLGLDSFAELAARRQDGLLQNRAAIEQVRTTVIRYLVPAAREARRLQKRRLNVALLAWYDLPCLFPGGDLQLASSLPDSLERAGRALSSLSGAAPSLIEDLLSGGYLAVAEDPSQIEQAAWVDLPAPAMPFVHVRSAGSSRDLFQALTVIGQAYGAVRSREGAGSDSLVPPDGLLRQVQGQTFTLLLLPQLTDVIGPVHDDAVMLHLTEQLLDLPRVCLLDEFASGLYQNQLLTADERNALWLNLEKRYLPDLDYEQMPCLTSGRAWQLETAFWADPFAAITPGLAALTSLDYLGQIRRNPASAWRRFDKLCTQSEQIPAGDLLSEMGFASPVDPDTVKKAAYVLCDSLSL
jgi:hypothetical protein